MSDKQYKMIRKQLRNVVQEILPEVLGGDLFANLQKENSGRLDAITAEVRNTLKQLDDRSKAVQDYIMRQVELAQVPAKTEAPAVTEEAKS